MCICACDYVKYVSECLQKLRWAERHSPGNFFYSDPVSLGPSAAKPCTIRKWRGVSHTHIKITHTETLNYEAVCHYENNLFQWSSSQRAAINTTHLKIAAVIADLYLGTQLCYYHSVLLL